MTSSAARRPAPPASPVKRAALIVRVSTQRQARTEEGSLTTQLQRLRQHLAYKRDVAAEQWLEAAVYELRAVSGKHSLRSPEFQRLFADIKAGKVNVVVCTALDRICRSVKDFLTFFEFLTESGAEFVSLRESYDTTSPQGRLLITIMMALAEFEREQTAERTRDATAARSERGLWNGGRILGYDPDPEHRSRLLVNEDEAAVVRAAFDLYRQCGSLQETANLLNRHGYRTKSYITKQDKTHSGGPFRITTVQALLKNVAYIGKKALHKEHKGRAAPEGKEYRLVEAVWPGIVDPETFDEVARLMAVNGQTRHNGAAHTRHVFVLAGRAQCGRCGTELAGRSGTGRSGVVYFYYTCPRATCGSRVGAGELEQAVLARIGTLAANTGLVTALIAETNTRLQRRAPVLAKQQRALERQLQEVRSQADGLLGQWEVFAGEQGRAFLTDKLTELGQRRTELERSLEEVETILRQVKDTAVTAKAVQEALGRVHELYGALQPHEQKELIGLVVRKAELRDRELVLELNGGICAVQSETPEKWLSGARFSQTRDWLRDQDSNLEPIG